MTRSRIVKWICLAIAVALVGCGSQEKTLPVRHRIKGMITYNGQPLEGATVTFWPVPVDANNWRSVKPIAIVEADGTFEPNSYDEKDGAETGEYALTIIYRVSRASPDLFGGRYSDPHLPIAKVTVKPGENVLPTIELKGPPLGTSGSKVDPGL